MIEYKYDHSKRALYFRGDDAVRLGKVKQHFGKVKTQTVCVF